MSGILEYGETNDYLTASTLAAGQHSVISKQQIMILLYIFLNAVPFAAPISVNISLVTSTTITVQWGRVECIHHNGLLTGYSVWYGVQGEQNTQTMNISGENVTTATISNLVPLMTYEMEVAAVNSADIYITGMFSSVMTTTTRQSESFRGICDKCCGDFYAFHIKHSCMQNGMYFGAII